MVGDAEVGSKTSCTTRLAKNLLASMNIADNTEVGESDSGDDKTVKKSSSKKLSGFTESLTSLYFNADSLPFKKR